MTIKYLVVPGEVTSANDGQRHWISATKLMRLYDVDPRECFVWDGRRTAFPDELIRLRPRQDGDYHIPSEIP